MSSSHGRVATYASSPGSDRGIIISNIVIIIAFIVIFIIVTITIIIIIVIIIIIIMGKLRAPDVVQPMSATRSPIAGRAETH